MSFWRMQWSLVGSLPYFSPFCCPPLLSPPFRPYWIVRSSEVSESVLRRGSPCCLGQEVEAWRGKASLPWAQGQRGTYTLDCWSHPLPFCLRSPDHHGSLHRLCAEAYSVGTEDLVLLCLSLISYFYTHSPIAVLPKLWPLCLIPFSYHPHLRLYQDKSVWALS